MHPGLRKELGCFVLIISKFRDILSSSKYSSEEGFLLLGSHVNPHLTVLFSKEKDVVAEYESHHLVKFKNSIHAPDEEAAKGIKFLQVVKDNFKIITFD